MCEDNTSSIIHKEKSKVEEKNNEDSDMENLANCLLEFIKNHKDDPSLLFWELELKEEMVRGCRVKEREDLWFIGEWSCLKYDSYPETNTETPIEGTEGRLYRPKDFWLVGKWTGQAKDWYFVASWGFDYPAAGEGVTVDVRIEKSQKGEYVVTDWAVMQYLFGEI